MAILKRYTTNAEAYLLYLKGQYHRWKTSRSDFASSLKFFRQAVELDPEFALGNFGISAYYGYGTAWGQLAILPEKAWPLATEYAERAGKIDPTLPELRLSQAARDLVNGRNWESAGRGFASVVDTSSNFAEIHHALSFYFLTLSRFDDSVREARRAVELDPLSLLFNRFVGFTLFCARRYDDAVSQLKETLEMEPNNSSVNELLGAAYIQKGMFAEAVESWRRAARYEGDEEAYSILSVKIARSSDVTTAIQKLAKLRLDRLGQEAATAEYVPSIYFAWQHIMSGDDDNALDWLEKAAAERNVFPLLINVDPIYDRLRSHRRFASIVASIGFPDGYAAGF